MFALEIDFHDGISPPETILVRRVNAIVGSSDLAHVVIEGAASSLCEVRLIRGLGSEFGCYPLKRRGQSSAPPPFLEGVYQRSASIPLGEVSVHITSLDSDLCVVQEEYYDKAAIRILRSALTRSTTTFPAVAVLGPKPYFLSFSSDSQVVIGRGRTSDLRLEASDVSSEHAVIGFDGERPWIEDLGSTNGTSVGNVPISGRRYLEPAERITIGSEFILSVVVSPDDVAALHTEAISFPEPGIVKSFPCITSQSKAVRPSRFPLREGATVRIGRDPANDIWISAAHVSRQHVEVRWDGDSAIELIDFSSNGTFVDGERLQPDSPRVVGRKLSTLDLCSGVMLGICFSEEDEKEFFSEAVPQLTTSGEQDPLDSTRRTYLESDEVEERRRTLERAAGVSDEYLGDLGGSEELGVFEKMAQLQANRAQTDEGIASEYSEEGLAEPEPESLVSSRPLSSVLGSRSLELGDSEFDRFQQEQLFGGDGMLEIESDYQLLSASDEDDEFMDSSLLGGLSRPSVAIGLFVLIVVIVLVSIVLFSDNTLFY